MCNATPSPDIGVSPAEMMFRRRIRTCLPTIRSRQVVSEDEIRQAAEKKQQLALNRKVTYDQTARDLRPLQLGDRVRIYNNKTRMWDIKGSVIYREPKIGRSYRIATDTGLYIFRNRRFIKPIAKFLTTIDPTKNLGGDVQRPSVQYVSYASACKRNVNSPTGAPQRQLDKRYNGRNT